MSGPGATIERPMSAGSHVPVLVDDVVGAFDFHRPATILDGTLGLGGHTEALLIRFPDMKVIGLEWDGAALRLARERLEPFAARCLFHQASYVDAPGVLSGEGIDCVDGFLLDLGLSSFQLDSAERGFSFQRSGSFDMRMSP